MFLDNRNNSHIVVKLLNSLNRLLQIIYEPKEVRRKVRKANAGYEVILQHGVDALLSCQYFRRFSLSNRYKRLFQLQTISFERYAIFTPLPTMRSLRI